MKCCSNAVCGPVIRGVWLRLTGTAVVGLVKEWDTGLRGSKASVIGLDDQRGEAGADLSSGAIGVGLNPMAIDIKDLLSVLLDHMERILLGDAQPVASAIVVGVEAGCS